MTKFPDGSVTDNNRMNTAAVRAVDACMRVCRLADLVLDEIDQATMPGVIRTPMADDEDSLVVALREFPRADTDRTPQ